jgi:cytochrome c biogenesis protein CcdA
MFVVPVVAAILFAVFALGGRWIQLHPERTVPKGHFVGPNTRGARLFRAQVAILGTLMVFGGTAATVFSLLSLLTSASVRLELFAKLIALVAGVLAAIRVRREVRTRPQYVSSSPYGWWP